jgi:hypothetical protein
MGRRAGRTTAVIALMLTTSAPVAVMAGRPETAPPSRSTAPLSPPAQREERAPEPVSLPEVPVTEPLLRALPSELPLQNSRHHRQLFNRVAAELYPFRWHVDTHASHEINLDAEEITMPAAARAAFGLTDDAVTSPILLKSVAVVERELERRRGEALRQVSARQRTIPVSVGLGAVPMGQRPMMETWWEVSAVMEQLHRLQVDRDAVSHVRAVLEAGDLQGIRLLHTNGLDACREQGGSSFCSLLPTFPRWRRGASYWPEAMTRNQHNTMRALTGELGQAVRSPVTRVTRTPDGTWGWEPLSAIAPFQSELTRLGDLLQSLLESEGIGGLQAYVESLKAAMHSKQAHPLAPVVAAWHAARGPIEVWLGPFGSTSVDHWGFKRGMTCVVGVDAPEVAKPLRMAFAPLAPTIEAALAALAPKQFTAKDLGPAPYVRPVQVMLASGDAHHLDPWAVRSLIIDAPPAGAVRKAMIPVNLITAAAQSLATMAPDVFVAADAPHITAAAAVTTAVLQQLVRRYLGPTLSAETADAVAAAYYDLAAVVIGQWMLARLQSAQVLTVAEVREITTTFVAAHLFQLRQTPPPKLSQIVTAYLHRAQVLREEQEGLRIDHAQVPGAWKKLLGEVLRAGASGDAEALTALLDGYAQAHQPLLSTLTQRMAGLTHPVTIRFAYRRQR